jgi:hypothetical protein
LYIDARKNAELIVKGKVTFNSNDKFGMYSFLGANTKLDIVVDNSASLNLDQNGSNAFRNSGFYANVYSGAELNIDVKVKGGGSFKSCGNGVYDIGANDFSNPPVTAKATFSGDGSYTCDNVYFPNDGTFVPPVCQACPSPPITPSPTPTPTTLPPTPPP